MIAATTVDRINPTTAEVSITIISNRAYENFRIESGPMMRRTFGC